MKMIAKNRFKTIMQEVQFDSHFCLEYLNNEGDKVIDAFHRLGLIVMLTTTDKKIHSRVVEWRDKLKGLLDKDVASLSEEKNNLLSKNESLKLPEVSTPDSYSYVFNIQHPIIWTLIDVLKNIDLELSETENLWLAGVISDEEKTRLSSKARNILRIHSSKIFKATSPGKRSGGRFNVGQFLNLLRGGLELYVDEKELDILVQKKSNDKSDNRKSNPKSNSSSSDVTSDVEREESASAIDGVSRKIDSSSESGDSLSESELIVHSEKVEDESQTAAS